MVPVSSDGTFLSSSITDTTISVLTTNYAGYTLGLAASVANNNALIFTSGDTVVDRINSISSTVTGENYANTAYALANNLTNTWGFRPSKYNSVTNTNNTYYPGPLTTTPAIIEATNVPNATVANNYNIAIGARVDYTKSPGIYENSFTITAVANPIPFTINYHANAGTDNVTNMPASPYSDTTYAENITLDSKYPARSGYVFVGWCTAVTSDGACSGTRYFPGASFPITQTAANVADLYAMWGPENELFYKVASMVKRASGTPRTQNLTDTKAVITVPTSSNPSTDTSTSGVYLYNSSLFGRASDASTYYDIYYYRGILDSNLDGTEATYGSNGNGAYYPNYVRLNNDTCWRIVRTTGSGGVKMIYNGLYSGGSTPNSCANPTTNAQIRSDYFNRATPNNSADFYGNKGFVGYVGYNYNPDYAYNHTENTSVVPNTQLFTNQTSSHAKEVIEDWYESKMTAYTSKLETNAGYCDDRSTERYPGQGTSTIPYAPTTVTSFGARYRLDHAEITLGCPNTSGHDILTTSNGLTYPVSLLTLDEIQLAGSGFACCNDTALNPATPNTYPSNWAYNSYLRSGSVFWLLSPYNRSSGGGIGVFDVAAAGYAYGDGVLDSYGLRPAISLSSGSSIDSGTGTATDPWVIRP